MMSITGENYSEDLPKHVCFMLEKYLEISITCECSTNIVCRKCQLHQNRAKEIIDRLKKSYHESMSQLYVTHGSDTKKRLLNEDYDDKPSRRKTLFPNRTEDSSSAAAFHIDKGPSVFVASVTLPDGQNFQVSQTLFPLLRALATSNFAFITSVALDFTDIKKSILDSVIKQLEKEVANLCTKTEASVLRQNDRSSILGLSWDTVVNEWQSKAPLYWAFLKVFISNPSFKTNKLKDANSLIPGLVTAGAKLMSLYNQQMSLVKHLNSVILLQGGAKKSLFNRLNATHDALSYNATVNQVEKYASNWADEIKLLKKLCETDNRHEEELLHNISQTRLNILEHGVTPDRVLYLAEQEQVLHVHRQNMHPGYYFVGDNVDFYTRVRHMTATRQNQSQHMFQMCTYKNRISGNHLDDSSPKADINTIPFSKFIPSEEECSTLKHEFAHFVAKAWIEYIPYFQSYAAVLPKFIPHEHLQDTKKRTERIPLGVLQKNEQYNAEMTNIAQFLHQFVPGHSEDATNQSSPQKVLSGGDYLTFERQKLAHHALGDGPSPSSRLQGLVPKMEEFHNQAEFLKMIWKHLYSASSSKSVGTLHAARSTINAVNVTQDTHDNYYPCSDFMEKVTTAYIVTGGLHYFEMEEITSTPSPSYDGAVGDPYNMSNFILTHAKQFVEKHVMPDIPQLQIMVPSPTHLCVGTAAKCIKGQKLCVNTRLVFTTMKTPTTIQEHRGKAPKPSPRAHLCTNTHVCAFFLDCFERITMIQYTMATVEE